MSNMTGAPIRIRRNAGRHDFIPSYSTDALLQGVCHLVHFPKNDIPNPHSLIPESVRAAHAARQAKSSNQKKVDDCAEMEVRMHRQIEMLKAALAASNANDKLRKAAEEVINTVHEINLYSAPLPRRFWNAFDDLRAALEGK